MSLVSAGEVGPISNLVYNVYEYPIPGDLCQEHTNEISADLSSADREACEMKVTPWVLVFKLSEWSLVSLTGTGGQLALENSAAS